ncbi:cytochrome c-type biogenesis protein [Humitalea sp. 24SJ18S-53]|uniref:cytochrome c-type biogenesis protein n=1 Tax=Humitalea sp. 24SJ18S-53 TaxID=3422307 RepID=UPI003D67067C
MRSLLALALVVLLSAQANAVGRPEDMLRDPVAEARARAIGRELRCMVCQNQSIEDSEADMARDLRLIVREQVARGATDAQVTEFIHARYGDFVLLRPPFQVGTLLLWGTPLIVLLGGGIVIALRSRRRAAAAPPLSDAEAARLAELTGDGRR